MLTFQICYEDCVFVGTPQYLMEEDSFFFDPWHKSDFSIMIGEGYNSLDVDLGQFEIKQLTGLNPIGSWIPAVLTPPPDVQKGRLLICPYAEERNRIQSGMGVQYAEDWPTHYDKNNGWVCLGNIYIAPEHNYVCFANDTIAVVDGAEITAIWIRPVFI